MSVAELPWGQSVALCSGLRQRGFGDWTDWRFPVGVGGLLLGQEGHGPTTSSGLTSCYRPSCSDPFFPPSQHYHCRSHANPTKTDFELSRSPVLCYFANSVGAETIQRRAGPLAGPALHHNTHCGFVTAAISALTP
jgi:hypothetical protein